LLVCLDGDSIMSEEETIAFLASNVGVNVSGPQLRSMECSLSQMFQRMYNNLINLYSHQPSLYVLCTSMRLLLASMDLRVAGRISEANSINQQSERMLQPYRITPDWDDHAPD
jgi:hypothetical protein